MLIMVITLSGNLPHYRYGTLHDIEISKLQPIYFTLFQTAI